MTNICTFSKLGRWGRFANQAYQIAGSIGIARRNGFDFAFPHWANHDGRNFEPGLDIDTQARFLNPLPLYEGPPLPEYYCDWGYRHIDLNQSTDLLGHFQSEHFFLHCIDEVKFYLTMKDEGPLNEYCAIHWRAGDYGEAKSIQHPDGNSYHPRMALSYYEPAMSLFGSKQKYMVFSDDIEGARAMFGDRVEYAVGNDYLTDFRLLKRCAHFIIANSSFSAMAAVLGDAPDKQVVAPTPWFSGPWRGMDDRDIFSPGWQVVNWETGQVTVKGEWPS